MIAFAGNSLLCRSALRETGIDAASFTLIRICAGAITLWLITRATRPRRPLEGSWLSALLLFAYAAAFSFAYLSLPTGTGALLLFGAVQATMLLWGWRRGERLHATQLAGLAFALGGLVLLVWPGIAAPPLAGSTLMIISGIAWGSYSLRGRNAGGDPVSATAGNFVRAVPLATALSLASLPFLQFDPGGVALATVSGALASGCGYAVWYTALPALRASTAATVQLIVPVLAAAGGILLLGEPLTLRFLGATTAVLGGIALVVFARTPPGGSGASRG
ncbi:MAG: DMT family transporter [Chthoniobacterales bacterium]